MVVRNGTGWGVTSSECGTVFRLTTDGQQFEVLRKFSGQPGDGGCPSYCQLSVSGTTLYGVTSGGGSGFGTIFSMNIDGKDFTLLHAFDNFAFLGAEFLKEGSQPECSLALVGSKLIGTASNGGANNMGTLFAYDLTPPGLTVTTAPTLPAGTVGTLYQQQLAATGGTPPYSWFFLSGEMPPGLTMTQDGAISGMPTGTGGTYSFTIQVIGAPTEVVNQAFSLTINPAPVPVPAIAGAGDLCVGLDSHGTVWTWGPNTHGELGDGTIYHEPDPEPVPGLAGVVAIDTYFGCVWALKADGTVMAWGNNQLDGLGINSYQALAPQNTNVPIRVTQLSGITAMATGGFNFVLRTDGTVGQFPALFDDGSLGVQDISGLDHVVAIASSTSENLVALKADGTVWTWGDNTDGQLGDGTTNDEFTNAVQVSGLTSITAVAIGYHAGIALRNDGTVWAWGLHGASPVDSKVPVQVSGATNMVSIANGSSYGIALKADGTVWGWGLMPFDFGNHFYTSAVQAPGLTDVVALPTIGANHLWLKADGTVWTWPGWNQGIPFNPVQVSGVNLGSKAPRITSASPLPTGMVGTASTNVIVAIGGALPYNWGLAGGSLPPGPELDQRRHHPRHPNR